MEGSITGLTSANGEDTPLSTQTSPQHLLTWLADGPVALPAGEEFLRADFQRAGPDLLIETPSGASFAVAGYFLEANPPALETASGAVLNAKLVTALAGPAAPGQVAQLAVEGAPGGIAQPDIGTGEPIGQVSEAEGTVTVTRADGTQAALGLGDNVFQGDVLETGAKGNVAVVFVDDTVFTLNGDSRMVLDEMVYDPGSQTGVFNAQVVQGVFSLVSGKIAKTGPDAMTVSTPELTIGIRGTTLLGSRESLTLMQDVDGFVGEATVRYNAPPGAPPPPPIVLNQIGGGVVLGPTGPTFTQFTPQQIQANFGASLTRLTKVIATKAQQDAQRASQEAEQRGEDAQQAENQAQQAEEEAAQAEAEAEAAAAEAAAAAEEAAAGDEEAQAKAVAAEAKAQEAAAKAEAAKAEAEAAAAEAAAKTAEAEAAQQQAQAAQQFQDAAQTAFTQQAQTFEQFQQGGPAGPDGAMIVIGADGAAQVLTGAMQEKGVININEKGDGSIVAKTAELIIEKITKEIEDEITKIADTFGLDGETTDGETIYGDIFDFIDLYSPFYEENLVYHFGETIIAPPGGGHLAGSTLNTNYYFHWGSINASAVYTITDAGGVNQISFDSLDTVTAKVVTSASSGTNGTIYIYNAATAIDLYSTITFSSIHQFLLSDVSVATFADENYTDSAGGDVLVFGTLHAGDVGYAVAYSDSAETITVNTTNYPDISDALIFAKGGGDTIQMNIASGDITVIGGITATDNTDTTGNDYIPDANINTFTYAGNSSFTAGSNGIKVLLHGYGNEVAGSASVTDRATSAAFHHDLWDVGHFIASAGDDLITAYSGYYNTLEAGAGADTVRIEQSAYLYTINTGTENDTLTIASSLLSTATGAGALDGDAGTDELIIEMYQGGTFDLSTVVVNFESVKVQGNFLASGSFTMTANDAATTFIGSAQGDTFVGGAGNDTLRGGYGVDTMTGGGGADMFTYTSALESAPGAGDSITDFDAGTNGTAVDKFDIGTVVQGSFSYEGTGAFAGGGNTSARFETTGNQVQIDVNGDGAMTSSDIVINVQADISANLNTEDFSTV